MIISDLEILEVVEVANVEGGQVRNYTERDFIFVDFDSENSFRTFVNSPFTLTNSAAAGAKGDAQNFTNVNTYAFTKADTVAYANFLRDSFSASTSAAVINRA